MDEAAIKALESLKLNNSVMVCVNGYDTSLPEDDIKKALRNHFGSCGQITRVSVPRVIGSDNLNKYALIYMMGEAAEGVENKALDLSGSDVGVWNVTVCILNNSYFMFFVTGYDTSLPKDDIQSALRKHFASCGEIKDVSIPYDSSIGALDSFGRIHIKGEGSAEKVLELNGSDVGGWNVVIQPLPVKSCHNRCVRRRCIRPAWLQKEKGMESSLS